MDIYNSYNNNNFFIYGNKFQLQKYSVIIVFVKCVYNGLLVMYIYPPYSSLLRIIRKLQLFNLIVII